MPLYIMSQSIGETCQFWNHFSLNFRVCFQIFLFNMIIWRAVGMIDYQTAIVTLWNVTKLQLEIRLTEYLRDTTNKCYVVPILVIFRPPVQWGNWFFLFISNFESGMIEIESLTVQFKLFVKTSRLFRIWFIQVKFSSVW
jgi:hypothetical protein